MKEIKQEEKDYKQEEKDFILKIARHFSELYKERTNAILHLADVIQQKDLSRDYVHDKQHMFGSL